MGPGAGLARAAPVRPREGNAQSHEFLRPFGGYLMGPVRFGLRSGSFPGSRWRGGPFSYDNQCGRGAAPFGCSCAR